MSCQSCVLPSTAVCREPKLATRAHQQLLLCDCCCRERVVAAVEDARRRVDAAEMAAMPHCELVSSSELFDTSNCT